VGAAYLFIDGAYLRSRLEYISKTFGIGAIAFDYAAFLSTDAQKAFYYDCLPAKGRQETSDEYEKRAEPQRNLFDTIKSLPGYHVFLGEAVHSGGEKRQKGADNSIAVDMLTHSFRRNIDRAILSAGDRDFEPLVSALVREGIYVIVRYHPTSISRELVNAADERQEYDTCKLWEFATPEFNRRFPAPRIGRTKPQGLLVGDALDVRKGIYHAEEALLYKTPNLFELYLPTIDQHTNEIYDCIYHRDEPVIPKILEERNITVSWR
jgi:uncharacterized LabA/DUF88 family protein